MNSRLSSLVPKWRPTAAWFASLLLAGLHQAPAADSTNTNSTASAHSTTPATPPARVDSSTFRVIAERNIFNAGRSGRAPMPNGGETRRPARVDAFGLVGTMDYEKGTVAFFDGNSSDYRKALRVDSTNATIAGWKLTAASFQGVKLVAETNSVELKVGMSLRREEEGPWVTSVGTDFSSSTSEASLSSSRDSGRDSGRDSSRSYGRDSSRDYRSRGSRDGSPTTVSSPSSSAPSADAAETLRKLMERRAKEDQ